MKLPSLFTSPEDGAANHHGGIGYDYPIGFPEQVKYRRLGGIAQAATHYLVRILETLQAACRGVFGRMSADEVGARATNDLEPLGSKYSSALLHDGGAT